MGARRTLLVLLGALLLHGTARADAGQRSYPLRIKVLTSESHRLSGADPVPKNCDFTNYDAYCNGSRSPALRSTMQVEDSRGESFTIACTVDTQWSKCVALPVGQTFEAREETNGLTVAYLTRKGKERSQLYEIVSAISTRAAPAPENAAGHATAAVAGTVACSFTSTPAGAEIRVDGQYVGSAPSKLQLAPGTHVVVLSMPGYAEWQRELAVTLGSDVNVTAILQKDEK